MAMNFSQFQLISMTNLPDGAFSVPGVSASTGTSNVPTVIGPGGSIDSVDGHGNNGHSLFASPAITFTFNPNVLGYLPTVAGIVWTDGDLPIHFTGIDAQGNSIEQVNDATGCGFSCGDGNPANYRFFGVIDPVGISSIEISDFSGTIEVDHLQFGLLATAPVPEPSTFALVLVPTALFLTILSRRRLRYSLVDTLRRSRLNWDQKGWRQQRCWPPLCSSPTPCQTTGQPLHMREAIRWMISGLCRSSHPLRGLIFESGDPNALLLGGAANTSNWCH
jgi:hypothetical protein